MLDEDIEAVSPAEMEWLREQLVRAQRLSSVGTLASSVAHEFNNILTTILNYAKMAQKPTATDASKNQALDRIVQASQRAAALVSGMLGMARPGTLKRQMTNLGTLVDEVLLLAGKDLSQHRIRVEKKIATVSAPVVSAQVEQVLLNLVINARQAMREGGTLRLEVRENKSLDVAEIIVADSGCGITAEALSQIFEPFFTTKVPDADGRGGSGLGLSVCRQIIENHHGRIRVESAPGRGSIFTLKLPLREEVRARAA